MAAATEVESVNSVGMHVHTTHARHDGDYDHGIAGCLIVPPAPTPRHQTGVSELLVRLSQTCPDDLGVLAAPWDVGLDVPAITVWELSSGCYVQTTRAAGSEQLTVERPFPVTLRPADLFD